MMLLSPLMRIDVELGPALDVGPTPSGYRRIIPILGGRFKGERLSGEVMPIGADWNLVRGDGVMTLSALYALRTQDGVYVTIHNEGMVRGFGDQIARMTEAVQADADTLYTRMKTTFEAPAGAYAWLNQSMFVGRMLPPDSMERVSVEIFHID